VLLEIEWGGRSGFAWCWGWGWGWGWGWIIGGVTFFEGSRIPMTVRTTSRTVTFIHPFSLNVAEVHPAGTYTVETDEELLQGLSIPAYKRTATLLRLERTTGPILTQIVETNPLELAGALARDAQPDETEAQLAHSDSGRTLEGLVAVGPPSVKAGKIG